MEKIPAKLRFSPHARISEVSQAHVRDAVARFGLPAQACTIERLSGGFMNANFLVRTEGRRLVFRFYSSERTVAERERDVLRFLEPRRVLVPRHLGLFESGAKPVAVLEHVDGVTLEDRILEGTPIEPRLYEEIGAQLARIHAIRFEEAGFIGPGLRAGSEYVDFVVFIRDFIERTMARLPDEKLDADSRKRVLALVREKWGLIPAREALRQLVHTDFNPKNILVSRGPDTRVLAVIDWEFCLSGNGLIDLGNFFRFSHDYAEGSRERFAAGYRAAGGELPEGWEGAARLMDLGNMCSFLERPESYPETFRTARAVVAATLEHFGY